MYKIKIVEGNIADGLEEKVNAEIEKKSAIRKTSMKTMSK